MSLNRGKGLGSSGVRRGAGLGTASVRVVGNEIVISDGTRTVTIANTLAAFQQAMSGSLGLSVSMQQSLAAFVQSADVDVTAASPPTAILLPELDGVNDYYEMSAGTGDGAAAGSAISFSYWSKIVNTSANVAPWQYDSASRKHSFQINLRQEITFGGAVQTRWNSGGPADMIDGVWNHICYSVSAGNASSVSWLVNDATVGAITGVINSAGTLPFNGKITLGAAFDHTEKLTGAIGYFWLDNKYVNWNNPTNRRKVITATGRPASAAVIGASGESITGSSPLIYLGNGVNSFEQNLGTLPNFTIVGAPTTANTTPIAASAGESV